MRARAASAAIALLVVASGTFLWLDAPERFEVSPGDDLQPVLNTAPPGSSVVLMPGIHEGPVTIDRALSVQGHPKAEVVAAAEAGAVVRIAGDGAELRGVTVRGGVSGVVVREAEQVGLEDVSVLGAELHGVEVVDASAHLSEVYVGDLRHELAQGIEIRNSDGRPDTIVESSTVVGGREGIVSHVSEVVLRDNLVTDTTMRGIAVTEMSDGVVASNTVTDAAGAGFYCGDMSRCQFEGNVARAIQPGDLGLPTEGWGLVVTYHAAASSERDEFTGEAGSTLTSLHGHIRSRSPLEPGSGWGGVPAVAATTGLALGVLVMFFAAAAPLARALRARAGAADRTLRPGGWIVPTAVAGIAVQTFHMIEHSLQVYRVRMDGIPSRGGIVGPVVEAEWIHLIYNSSVLIALVLVLIARGSGWRPPGRALLGDRLLMTAVVVQGYHWVEHVAKVVQHVQTGAKVNDGIAGNFFDLVLFHFGINLTVYIAVVGAAVAYALRPGSFRSVPLRRAIGHATSPFG